MNYCIEERRTPSLRGEVLGADTTGPAVASLYRARGREPVHQVLTIGRRALIAHITHASYKTESISGLLLAHFLVSPSFRLRDIKSRAKAFLLTSARDTQGRNVLWKLAEGLGQISRLYNRPE